MQRHVSHLQLTYLAREGHILPRPTNAIAAFLKSVSSEILPSDDLQLKTVDRRLMSVQR
jgi:hypothetical protein